jgi:hypothetical protein
MYYDASEAYLTDDGDGLVGTPAIGSYLGALDDPLTTQHYVWIDNSIDNQAFCAYATLEKAGTNTVYFCADQDGTAEMDSATAPTLANCCH